MVLRCVLVATILMTSICGHAQLLLKAGVNICMSNARSETGLNPGLYAGVAGKLRLTEKLSFQPGMMYSMQTVETGLVQYRAQCFQMPLYFDLRIDKGTTGVGLLAGPQVGIMGSLKRVAYRSDVSRYPALPTSFDVGFAFGPYIQANDAVRIEVRYVASFIDRTDIGASVYNSVIQLGVSLALGKPSDE